MYQGTTNALAKVWNTIGGQQIDELKAGTAVKGDAPRADGYVLLASPVLGYTKKAWITSYQEFTSPLPEPEPIPTKTVKHVIRVFTDGSIQIDDGAIIP